MLADGGRASRLSNDSDTVWITTKLSNVLLDPFEGKALIEKASVGSTTLLLKVAPAEPAIGTKLLSMSVPKRKHRGTVLTL